MEFNAGDMVFREGQEATNAYWFLGGMCNKEDLRAPATRTVSRMVKGECKCNIREKLV